MFERVVDFRGSQIPPHEADVLQELEDQLNKKFKLVDDVSLEGQLSFSVKNNQVTGIRINKCSLKEFPESIEHLSSLQKLFLEGSDIKSERENQLTTLPMSIGNLFSLKELSIQKTPLTILPESIGNLKSLLELYLMNNKLTSLPESIGNLSSLEILDVSSNNLRTLPDSIEALSSLKRLNLTYNELTALPELIGNLQSLRHLDLNRNKLTILPESIGNLQSLKHLGLNRNKLTTLPDSMINYFYLQKMERDFFKDFFKTNPFNQEFISRCKAEALKSSSFEREYFMQIVEDLEEKTKKTVVPTEVKLDSYRRKVRGGVKMVAYVGFITFISLLSFLVFKLLSRNIYPLIFWTLFPLFIGINFIVGASIISTLSGYLKKYVDPIIKRSENIRKKIFGLFDIFVIFYFLWSIRATVKTISAIELIPVIDFAFEFTTPQWLIDILVFYGYNIDLTFLENLDLFLGQFIYKILGIALVFWALFQYGLGSIKKTAFEEGENKKIWFFFILGIFGSFSYVIMEYSTLKEYLSGFYSVGVIFGCCIFIWETNKERPSIFFIYLTLIGSGILIVWLLYVWNSIISVITGVAFVVAFFIIRWRINISKIYLTYSYDITAEQNSVMKELQLILKKPIPQVEEFGGNMRFGVKIVDNNVIGLGFFNSGLISLPESIDKLKHLQYLDLRWNKLTTLPESIGNLKLLEILELENNKFITFPDSIRKLTSLKKLVLQDNRISRLPKSVQESVMVLHDKGVKISDKTGRKIYQKPIYDLKERELRETAVLLGVCKGETEKALLIAFEGAKEIWVPKSAIRSSFNSNVTTLQKFEIYTWILKKNNLF